jgi:hypothetical protein
MLKIAIFLVHNLKDFNQNGKYYIILIIANPLVLFIYYKKIKIK